MHVLIYNYAHIYFKFSDFDDEGEIADNIVFNSIQNGK